MKSKITAIEVQKKNKKRVNIFLDNDFAFSCDAEIIFKYQLKTNEYIEARKINDIAAEDNFIRAKSCAIAYIQKALKTEKEVRNKLNDKGYDQDIITRVIEFMKKYDLVNDESYVKAYINTEKSKNGINKIKHNLLRKGIPECIISSVLSDVCEDDQINSAKIVAEKKYKSLLKLEQDKVKLYNKLIRFLTGRGYSYEMSKKLSKEVIKYGEE